MTNNTKPESEKVVRRLCHKWLAEQPEAKREHPSFTDFKSWLLARYPDIFSFRSVAGPLYDADMWFDQELKQTWRR